MDLVGLLIPKLSTLEWVRLLTILTVAPYILGMVLILVGNRWRRFVAPVTCLLVCVVSFASACGLLGAYKTVAHSKQPLSQRPVAPVTLGSGDLLRMGEGSEAFRISYLWGVDGISVLLVWLTSALTLSSVLISIRTVRERTAEYYSLLLLMASSSMLVFLAFDILLFYVFLEFSLVPMFFLIGIWGGPEKRYAARKFFIYTLAGSLMGLVSILAYVVQLREYSKEVRGLSRQAQVSRGESAAEASATSLPELAKIAAQLSQIGQENRELQQRWDNLQKWVFWGLFLAFAIKVPLVPWHTWLPLAHVEAPTAGSVFLAGILLKLGTYGFLRIGLPLLPNAMTAFGLPAIALLALVGIIYGSLCAAAQEDIKRLVAYSSIAHMGFCMLGMAATNTVGLAGSVLEMMNHGLYTGGLFLLVGMLYERYHTRNREELSGLAKRLPMWSFFMVGMGLASIALPGLNGFISETLCLAGAFAWSPWYGAVGAVGMVLGAWYIITLLRQVVFGPLQEPADYALTNSVNDLDFYEWSAAALLLAWCLALGVYPKAFLDLIRPDLEGIASLYQALR